MTVFSLRTLAFAWTGLAGAAAVGAGALQASYVPPVAEAPQAAVIAAQVPAPPMQAAVPPAPAPVPFENRSLPGMLPPDTRPHAAQRAAAPEPLAALPLPIPPVPPAAAPQPVRLAHAEPRRFAPVRSEPREPGYEASAPVYPSWDWGRQLPYPGQFAAGRAYYYGGQPPSYYGW